MNPTCSPELSSAATGGSRPVGRLAPSPTGLLHLGNAWSFLLAWLAARVESGRLILRMEDIDPARSRQEWADRIIQDLHWLGLDWDEGPEAGPHAPYAQSQCGALYEQALARLEAGGHVYPCFCTRKELRSMAGAPHDAPLQSRAGILSCEGSSTGLFFGQSMSGQSSTSDMRRERGAADGGGDTGAPYPGTCRCLSVAERDAKLAAGRRFSWRLACPEGGGEAFTDAVLGPVCLSYAECGGDFALRRSDGVWAYQLAVSVDDARMGVTQVVRGEDIVWSTPRQLLLLRLLGAQAPSYAHVPLLYDSCGERLAKRHQSLALRSLRDAGVAAESVVGVLSELAGFTTPGDRLTATELCVRLRREHSIFPWQALPRTKLMVPDTLSAQRWADCRT